MDAFDGGVTLAIILDERAQEAVSRRRARAHDSRLMIYVDHVRRRGSGFTSSSGVVTVSWIPRRWPRRTLFAREVGDVTVFMDRRVARYTQWNELTISAWHVGPIHQLLVSPLAILDIEAWERTHPEPALTPAALPLSAGRHGH